MSSSTSVSAANKAIIGLSAALGISLFWNWWTLRSKRPERTPKFQPRLVRIENYLVPVARIRAVVASPLPLDGCKIEVQIDSWRTSWDFPTVPEALTFLQDIEHRCNCLE